MKVLKFYHRMLRSQIKEKDEHFDNFLNEGLNSKLTSSASKEYLAKNKSSSKTKNFQYNVPNTHMNGAPTNGKLVRKKQWKWSSMMRMKLGTTPFLKLEKPSYPTIAIVGSNMMPPAMFSHTLEIDEVDEDDMYEDQEIIENIAQIGGIPLDGDDPLIYSEVVSVPPYSFLNDNAAYSNKAPPPTYIPYSELSRSKPTHKKEILHGLEVNKNGILQCTDKEMLEKSKGAVGYVGKQIAKNFFTGLGVSNISLPVRIFEPRSALERVLDGFSYAPKFLNEAGKISDPIERLKLVISFVMSGVYMQANTKKPFNPILGETLEGMYSDGTKIFMEHTSHHPPISNYLIEGPSHANYKFYGSNEFVAQLKSAGNILSILFKGPNIVEFPNGDHIMYTNQWSKVKGLMYGDKLIFMEGNLEFIDERNNLKAVIFMEPKKHEIYETDDNNSFEGIIYEYNSSITIKSPPDKVSAIKDGSEQIGEIYGSWLENLVIDDIEFWNIDTGKPYRLQVPKVALPSDARYREDLIWLHNKDEDYAQEWKNLLEIQQRKDKMNRQTAEKKRKKEKYIYKF